MLKQILIDPNSVLPWPVHESGLVVGSDVSLMLDPQRHLARWDALMLYLDLPMCVVTAAANGCTGGSAPLVAIDAQMIDSPFTGGFHVSREVGKTPHVGLCHAHHRSSVASWERGVPDGCLRGLQLQGSPRAAATDTCQSVPRPQHHTITMPLAILLVIPMVVPPVQGYKLIHRPPAPLAGGAAC